MRAGGRSAQGCGLGLEVALPRLPVLREAVRRCRPAHAPEAAVKPAGLPSKTVLRVLHEI